MGVAYRFSGPGQPYEGLAKKVGDHVEWTNRVRCVDELLDAPTRWRKPRRIFVNSMSDLFHPAVPDHFIWHVFAVMAACPQHTFQVLTKRPERMYKLLSHPDCEAEVGTRMGLYSISYDMTWPLPNVWLGVSAEDQATANERIPLLLDTPAAVRWVSAEPLLGPLTLTNIRAYDSGWMNALTGWMEEDDFDPKWGPRLDWVVVGGESGQGARPMHPRWAQLIRDECSCYNVAFFFKQWGEVLPSHQYRTTPPQDEETRAFNVGTELFEQAAVEAFGGRPAPRVDYGDGTWGYRIGKKQAGRLLDGREWSEYPAIAKAAR